MTHGDIDLKADKGSWMAYPRYLLSTILGKDSFKCTLDISKLKKSMVPFYAQLFEAWKKISLDPGNDDPFRIRREVLWANKNIQIGRKDVYYKEWYKKGIIIFHDILDDRGNIKSIPELSREYNIEIKAMEYNSLKSAIPQLWKTGVKSMRIQKEAISNKEQLFISCNKRILALEITINKDVYWELVSRKQIKPI